MHQKAVNSNRGKVRAGHDPALFGYACPLLKQAGSDEPKALPRLGHDQIRTPAVGGALKPFAARSLTLRHDMSRASLLLTSLALTGPFALAQTSTTPHRPASGAAHRTSSTAHAATRTAGPPCAVLPTISPKIPALPASAGCPKVLFTVSDRLDYLNPLAERFRSALFAELPVVISLAYADTAPGTGELAKPQLYYTVKYTGYLLDGTKFDSSDDHDETKAGFTFPYGAHRVIAGWDLGFEGMRLGGKRRLYIPYQFAYGASGQPPKIPPKATLVFDMELISQSAQPPTPPTRPSPPTTPTIPTSPATPTTPASPTTPTTPSSPGAPTTPVTPKTPATPTAPTAPPAATAPTTPPHR